PQARRVGPGDAQRGQRSGGGGVPGRAPAVPRDHRGQRGNAGCAGRRPFALARGSAPSGRPSAGAGTADRRAIQLARRMNFVITVVAFIVALGVLIVFHELGHYFVARLFDVKVLRFSIGFGRALWTFRRGTDRTEWVIAALPLGGYVKMLDEREGPVETEEAHRAFNNKTVWRRIAIVAAGPVA